MATTTRITTWATNTLYYKDEPIYTSDDPSISVQYHYKYYRAKVEHTSLSFGTDWGNGLWEEITLKGIKGDTGEQGPTGTTGATGAKGDTGATGANGNDGVFAAIASQLEAETGTDNVKGMTPLRTKQAFDVQFQAFEDNFNTVTVPAWEDRLSVVEGKVAQIANATELVNASGEQALLNNQIAPVEILGEDGGGSGNRWELNSIGARSARIRAEIYRKDDAETRFSVAHLEMHFIPSLNQWAIARTGTTVLVGEEDGVTFSVATTSPSAGIYVGQVSYVSDDMIGGNYDSVNSYVKFLLEEISNL